MRLLSSVQGENLFTLHQNENLEKQQEIFYNAIHPFWIIQNTCIVVKNYKFIIIINFVEDCIPFRGNRFIRGNLLLWLKIDHFTKILLFIQVHIALIRSALSDFTKRERFFIKYLIARFAQLPLFKLHFYSRKGRS